MVGGGNQCVLLHEAALGVVAERARDLVRARARARVRARVRARARVRVRVRVS